MNLETLSQCLFGRDSRRLCGKRVRRQRTTIDVLMCYGTGLFGFMNSRNWRMKMKMRRNEIPFYPLALGQVFLPLQSQSLRFSLQLCSIEASFWNISSVQRARGAHASLRSKIRFHGLFVRFRTMFRA